MLQYLLYPVYLLQLENYNLKRFFNGATRHWLKRPLKWRQKIVWTPKLVLVSTLSLCLVLLLSFVTSSGNLILHTVLFILCFHSIFIFLAISSVLVLPLEKVIKKIVVKKAYKKLQSQKKLIVIGIAGSYGKTTIKEMLAGVIKQKYHVLATPDSINTPLGIARHITKYLVPSTQYLVVEMGEFVPGDVKEICELVKPQIGVITGINEAHMERMGSLENTVSTIFELAKYSRQESLLVLNADDENIVKNYEKYTQGHKVKFYSSNNSKLSEYSVQNIQFDINKLEQTFSVTGKLGEVQEYSTSLLGHYAIGVSIAAKIIAGHLGISGEQIGKGIASLAPVPHRLQPIYGKGGVLVIDDSYNGNPEGVKEAIQILAQFSSKRKIFLTPGLVEMGKETQAIHREIGKQLADVANLVILVKTPVADFIKQGLESKNFNKDNILEFPTAQEAHASLKNLLKPDDVILFQNDWPDNYL